MLRALVTAMLVSAISPAAWVQNTGVLRIRVVLIDAQGRPTPVPQHAFLISDNPPTATPRLATTRVDGTADVTLRAGNYTVESDNPATFEGKAYQWRQTVDVAAGRETTIEFTGANAEIESVTPSAAPSGTTTPESDASFLLPRWQDSVVAIWTSTARASGTIIDARGLVATSLAAIGKESAVEVQLSPSIKIAASVLAVDAARDVAVLRVDPKTMASVQPVAIPCGAAPKPALMEGQGIFTILHPLRRQKDLAPGTVTRVDPKGVTAEVMLPRGGAGGPVFTARGEFVGITSPGEAQDESSRREARIVGIDSLCNAMAAVASKVSEAAPPSAAHLPIEPSERFPMSALQDFAERRTGKVAPYQLSSAAFDVAFITPVLLYASQYQASRGLPRTTSGDTRGTGPPPALVEPLADFANWTEYVADFPPVLLVRVTPKLSEGFWTKMARGAARTQGVAIPPIKRITSGFARLRALCGEAEITPIHPFRLVHDLPTGDTVHEGLYVFDPGALGPHCGTVKLVLYSEKEPQKGDTRAVDAAIIQQVWEDFAAFRALGR